MNKIAMPLGAKTIVQGLRYANYDAYVVGGCVRDSLLGLEPRIGISVRLPRQKK